VFSYDDWLRRYAENGCNFARLWLSLEWNDLALITKDSGYDGIDLQRAWHIDHVLELAEKYDIRLMLCFDAHGMQRFVCKDSTDTAGNRRRFYKGPISQQEGRPAWRNFFLT